MTLTLARAHPAICKETLAVWLSYTIKASRMVNEVSHTAKKNKESVDESGCVVNCRHD